MTISQNAQAVKACQISNLEAYKVQGVSVFARFINALFGSPNWRRANGIISTRLDLVGICQKIRQRLFNYRLYTPVFVIDPVEGSLSDELPRIWLSEKVANTASDDGRRVFVESYPSGFDYKGNKALELGDRYLGEGLKMPEYSNSCESVDCFTAAEILYMHALRRGNRCAVSRLKYIYDRDLCQGRYWKSNREKNAKHIKKRSHLRGCTFQRR